MPVKYLIDAELAENLVTHLELVASGGVQTPEIGARMLRQLKAAMAQRGFMPTKAETHPEMYANAPPPGSNNGD